MAEQTDVTPQQPQPAKGIRALVDTVKAWPLPRKIALAAVSALTIGLFAFIIIKAQTADYQLLYGNLADTDASAVVEWLKGHNVPYQLTNNGKNISIPAKDVYETRLSLAATGLPQGGGVGFEIFDKQSFALTDFVQKVNYSRALQGELARTITSLGPVESARVHLALPEKRLFKEQQQPATASVILKLAPRKRLTDGQIEGIVHLVSSSIEGLEPDKVTIIDQNGNVLSKSGGKGPLSNLSPDLLAYQAQVEQRLETRAQALLDKSLGPKNAMVRVSAVLDFAQTEKTEETFDPEEPVIRSEQVSEEKTGSEMVGGVPGVQSNLEGNTNQSAGASPPSSRSQRTTNYEISKVVSKTINPVGTLSKLSVSVLVADKVVPGKEKEPPTTEARTAEELKSVETMVSSALGIDLTRGDKIEVTSMPFLESIEGSPEEEAYAAANRLYQYTPFIRYGLLLLAGVLLYFLMVRPLIKTLNRDVTEHYKTVEEMEAEQAGVTGGPRAGGAGAGPVVQEGEIGIAPGTAPSEPQAPPLVGGEGYQEAMEVESEDPLDKIRKGVEIDPVFTAHVLRSWIRDEN
nr:flagellar basal-body MS-ring/collar protein FliF [uncultured Desulfobulbus sp.]